MTSEWDKLQDPVKYTGSENNVFHAVLSIIKEQWKRETRKWYHTNKNN